MRIVRPLPLTGLLFALVLSRGGEGAPAQEAAPTIPVIYSTDLFHPYGDPDDHYDLATLFALPELEVRAIVLDRPQYQDRVMQPAIAALHQIFELTGRRVPYAVGLLEPLATREDTARDREPARQAGVKLILDTLRASREQVLVFITGSCADVAAAWNREPELLREKVRAVYVNAGLGPDGVQDEYNVRCDPHAFARLITSDLPLWWFPCMGREGYRTYFRGEDSDWITAAPPRLRRFFVYALTRSNAEPLAFLDEASEALPEGPRNMWCTPAFFLAAGRKVYRTERGYEALRPEAAQGSEEVEPYTLHPLRLAETPPFRVGTHPPGKPGEPRAALVSDGSDRFGSRSPEPDGEPDCLVLVTDLPTANPLASLSIEGPREGRWESEASERWWRVWLEREGEEQRCAFRFWAAGEHRLTLRFEDGTERVVPVTVTLPGAVQLRAELDAGGSTLFVLRNDRRLYGESMISCLGNLLATFPVE